MPGRQQERESMKPLFIPLKREFYTAYACGQKFFEVRRYGPRWNERVCPVGRKVILSCGYSGSRLRGTIHSFRRSGVASKAAREIYPGCSDFAVIGIDLR